MRLLFTGMIAFLSYITCFGQVDTTKIPFIAYWSKGDSYNFRITKIKKHWREGDIVKNDSLSYTTNFLVIDSTEQGYSIKWSFETDMSLYKIPPELAKKFTKYRMTEVVYQTDALGSFVGINNWEEISTMMGDMCKDIVNYMVAEKETERASIEKLLLPYFSVYNSKEGIEKLVFMELQTFHFPFGVEYSTTEPILYKQELANMLGGAPIKADSKLYIESVDYENSVCTLIHEMTLDSVDSKAMIGDYFKRINMKEGKINNFLKTAVFDIKDFNVFQYFYDLGIPYYIETYREVLIDIDKEKGERIDITRIELID